MTLTKLSVKLSYLLRHSTNPQYIDFDGGWADTQEIIKALKKYDESFNIDTLERIVAEDQKGRYSFNDNHTKIRANQGHSIPGVIIEMTTPEPPEILYHGTATRFLDSIMVEGLKPMSRQFVHISPDYETAVNVGSRHGKPVVLAFRAKDYVNDGPSFSFRQTEYGNQRMFPLSICQ
jgi:putative RNA 2'-phosphotransferase